MRRARRCTVEKGKGAGVLDGVKMADEDGASFCTCIKEQGWYVEREIRVVRTYHKQGLIAAAEGFREE